MTTTGVSSPPNSPLFRMSRASATEVATRWRAVGTLWRSMKSLANALLDSRRAASRGGPATAEAAPLELVHESRGERRLAADDGEFDALALGEIGERRNVRRA